ncbi:MAG: hypothetical protein Q8P86_01050 [bacterium]|nr:hypothetical protein [bacterium]
MRSKYISLIIAAALIFISGVATVSAQGPRDNELSGISFPVKELGNCGSKEACHSYCEDEANRKQCIDFARRSGLLNEEEARHAEKFADFKEGPGRCKTRRECESYCENVSHMEECLSFAEENGLMPTKELAEAKKFMRLMRDGEMPGGCGNKSECEAYCTSGNNIEECVTFFEKHGVMSKEELEMFRKTGGRGPGGCRGRECERFCNDPDNREACFAFAKEHGLLSEEEMKNVEEGMGHMRKALSDAPSEVVSCIKEKLGSDVIAKMESGQFMPGPQAGEAVRTCFDSHFRQSDGPGNREMVDNTPPQVLACLESKVGSEVIRKMKNGESPDRDIHEEMDACFKEFGGPREGNETKFRPDRGQIQQNGDNMPPPNIADCQRRVMEDVGASEERPDPETIRIKIEECIREYVIPLQDGQIHDFRSLPPSESRPYDSRDGNISPTQEFVPVYPEGEAPDYREFYPPPSEFQDSQTDYENVNTEQFEGSVETEPYREESAETSSLHINHLLGSIGILLSGLVVGR